MPIAGCILLQREAAGAWLGAAVTLTFVSLVQGCDQEPRCGACMKSVTVCVRVAPGGWFCHGGFATGLFSVPRGLADRRCLGPAVMQQCYFLAAVL